MKKLNKFLLIFLLSLSLAFPSFAADSTITGLTDLAGVPATDDEFAVWDTSTTSTKKVSYAYIATFPNADAYGGLTSAVAAIGATETTVLINTAQTVSDDLTVPATMSLFIVRGGSISVANTKTLTINGTVIAGSYQIFTGTGTTTYSGTGISYGKWWSGGDDSVNTPRGTNDILGFTYAPFGKNLLVNGGMEHAQRGASGSASFTAATTPANNDDTYLVDRWVILSDGNDIVDVTQQTLGGVSGQEAYVRLDVETTGKKFGFLQIIENKKCKPIIGGTASVSVELQVSNASKLSDVRMAVFSFNEGIDTPTSDLVSAWEAQGTVITPIANVTAENVAADLNVTTSWVRYEIENISIDSAGADNVALFIYSNAVGDNDTAGIFLEITNAQLEPGAVATDFECLDPGDSLVQCNRFCRKSYDQVVAPGSADTDGSVRFNIPDGGANVDYTMTLSHYYGLPMRNVPTITIYDMAGTGAKCSMEDGDGKTATVGYSGTYGFAVASGANGGLTVKREMYYHFLADSEL